MLVGRDQVASHRHEDSCHSLSAALEAVLVFLTDRRFAGPAPSAVVHRAWEGRRKGFCTRDFLIVNTQTSYLLLACIIAVLGFGLALVLPSMTEAVISHAPKAQSGLAAGMLNVSRQVGGVLEVAILGTLVGNLQTFLSGMHIAFVVARSALVLALLAAWLFVRTRR